jgi:hypothetical protein
MKVAALILLVFFPYSIFSQDGTGEADKAFLDSIYTEMDEILEEMLQPKSFLSVGLGAGTGFYNFKSATATQPVTEKKLLISPSVAYLHRSGLGLSASSFIINEQGRFNAYQHAITPSFDIIRRRRFSTGVAYTHYFTKKDLAFYTTPIQNEVYAFFNYKKPFIQPGVAVAYGWGSRTTLEQRRVQLLGLRRKRNPALVTVRNDESVRDFATLFSVRKDFTFTRLLSDKDLLTITPVVLLSAGTQSFGFNTSFQGRTNVTNNFLPNNQYVQDQRAFDTQSTTAILRADYSAGMFFVQTQVLIDYYLHSADNRLNNAVSLICGINL